jgi:hypothetical protein
MRTRYGIIWMFLGAAVVIGLIAALAPRMNVTVCRVPSTRYALGARVVLESVKRTPDGHVQIKMTAIRKPDPNTSVRFDEPIRLLRPDVHSYGWGYGHNSPSVPPSAETFSMDASFAVSDKQQTVDLSESIILDRQAKRVIFRFPNMGAGGKQSIVLKGKAGVTIRNVEFNEPVLEARWKDHENYNSAPNPIPPSTQRIKIELDTTFPYQYNDQLYEATLTDDRGRKHPVLQAFTDYNATVHLPPTLTLAERAIGVVDRTRAYNMALRRQERASKGKPELLVRMLTFPAIYPKPKYVTLEIPGTLPPDPKDVVTLTFRNVPVGK